MNANELMIGDWVHRKIYLNGRDNPPYEENVQIVNLYGNYINCEIRDNTIISGSYLYYFNPIPLTAEILEKNGWDGIDYYRQYGSASGVFNDDYKCEIGMDKDGRCFLTINTWEYSICEIKGVHELQHALRLCGLNELADNLKI